MIAPQILARGLRYSYVGGEKSLSVLADPERLQQIVLNLLTNAVKFTEHGEVQVHVMSMYHADGFPELYRLSNLDAEGKPTGSTHTVSRDEGLRETSLEKLAELKPIQDPAFHRKNSRGYSRRSFRSTAVSISPFRE